MNKLHLYIILIVFITKTAISQNLFQKKIINGTLNDIIQTDDGGFIACGTFPYNNPTILPNGTITKIDINGNVQWTKQYLATQTNSIFGSIIQTKDGGYIALAAYNTSTNSSNPNFLPYIVKTDVNGNVQWSKIIYSNPIYGNLFIRQTFDKGYAIVCNPFLQGGSNIQFIKTDSLGNMLWNKLYTSGITINPIIPASFIQTTDGGYFMTAGISTQNGGANYTALLKMDDQGNVEWSKMFTASDGGIEGGHAIETKDKGYILSDAETAGTLTKLDSIGNVVWERIFYEFPDHIPIATNEIYNYNNNGLIYTSDGGFALFAYNGRLVKTDSLGILQWAKIYKKVYSISSAVQILDYEGSDNGFAALSEVGYTNTFMIKTDAHGNSICDSNITVIDSLITPATTTSLSITVTSAGTLLSNITTIASPINIQDSLLCSGTVGINKITNPKDEIVLYPNPSSTFINIELKGQNMIQESITIYNMLGACVYKQTTSTGNNQINIADLNAGVYTIEITNANQKTVKRLVKQ